MSESMFTEQFLIEEANELDVTVRQYFNAVFNASKDLLIEGMLAQSKGEPVDHEDMHCATLVCLAKVFVAAGMPVHEALEEASKEDRNVTIEFDGENLSFKFGDDDEPSEDES